MRLPNESTVIENRAIGRRVLHKSAKDRVVEFEPREIVDLDLDAKRFCACVHDFDGLWMTIIGDEKDFPVSNDCVTKRHCFGGRGRFIEQRSVGNIERGEIGHHGLEIEQRFEPALRELGLIRRVGRIPTGIFEDVSPNDRGRNAIGVAGANKRARDLIFPAITRSSASASLSDFASGKFNCRFRRIFFGIAASMSASRFSKPSSRNITSISSLFGTDVTACEGIEIRRLGRVSPYHRLVHG